jgi:hypothetical protein
VPPLTKTTSSLRSSSEDRNSNAGTDNLDPDGAHRSHLSNESLPLAYANPALDDKPYVPQFNQATSVADDSSPAVSVCEEIARDVIVPSNLSSVTASDSINPLNRRGGSSPHNWDMDLVKVENPEDFIFENFQIQEDADTYIDGDGLHTYDSLEFQTLREHNLASSHSTHSF